MMDFGLTGLLDRVERDFGKRWANILTFLIGVAIVAGCFTIVGNFISSLGLWLSSISSEQTWMGRIYLVLKYAVGFGLLIILANNFVTAFSIRRYDRIVQEQLHEAEALSDDARERLQQVLGQKEQIDELYSELLEAIEMVSHLTPDGKDLWTRLNEGKEARKQPRSRPD